MSDVLTVLEQTLAHAHGLGIAAAATLAEIEDRVDDAELGSRLASIAREEEAVRARCLEAERRFGAERAEELLARANATYERTLGLVTVWFTAGTDPLGAWSYLAMSESGEVAVWSALADLAERHPDRDLAELAAWALALQKRHLEVALEGATLLAGRFDPAAPRWG
jgi:hypothetical protein